MRTLIAPGWRLLLLFVLGIFLPACRPASAKEKSETRVPLALETFDEVWRIIYEHHFDTNFNGVDWVKVKEKYRPQAAAAKSTSDFRDILQEMIDLLHVSHMAIIPGDLAEVVQSPKSGNKKGAQFEEVSEDDSGTAGLEVRLNGKEALVTQVEQNASKAGVRPGWIIKRIGNTTTDDLLKKFPRKLDERK